ncbi:MAG TPA: hypothetical protein VJO53_00110 [Candidatus Acidoferrales bacterium]|nr:hypothetical protein [Candidatus Acidoferrales bacterium]
MRSDHFTASSFQDRAQRDDAVRSLLENRRRYNRLYMRRWRALPSHRERERENRERSQYRRKSHDLPTGPLRYTNSHGEPVCGFCRRNPPVSVISRLQVCEYAPHGYAEVRIPYCGLC